MFAHKDKLLNIANASVLKNIFKLLLSKYLNSFLCLGIENNMENMERVSSKSSQEG